ncbi:MAG TPA: class I SAM-dependent methyltransferase [Vicinamibacterales bacterium]|nr:class I SAM-dependent methyltransferase [Vicinamibacterales bacterium]
MEIPAALTRVALAFVAGACLAATPHAQSQQQGGLHGRLFPPSDLGLLDAPDRDLWQRPDQIMDAMAIADASVVADIGAGSGWFTIRLARRVGPRGLVYAEDVQKEMINAISRRVSREGFNNVKGVLGLNNDPLLPAASLDAALMVDAYHEVQDRVAMLSNIAKALKPQGRLGIVDFKLEGTGPGPDIEERVSPDVVVRDAQQAGLKLLRQETFLPYQYFLIFGK